jgi:hypothetical protein
MEKDNTLHFSDTNRILKNDGFYHLIFSDQTIILRDTLSEDDPFYIHYKYTGSYEDVGLLCFDVYYYEIGTTLLINQLTGDSLEVYGKPLLSPTGQFLFNASQILNYEPFPNILQIWAMENLQIKLLVEYYPSDWTPRNIKWINDSSIVFEQRFQDNRTAYARIEIRQ